MSVVDHTDVIESFWREQQAAGKDPNHAACHLRYLELDKRIDAWEDTLDPLPKVVDVSRTSPAETAVLLFRAQRRACREMFPETTTAWEVFIHTPDLCVGHEPLAGRGWRVCFEAGDDAWGVSFTCRNTYEVGEHTFVGLLDNKRILAEPYYTFDVIFSEV